MKTFLYLNPNGKKLFSLNFSIATLLSLVFSFDLENILLYISVSPSLVVSFAVFMI